MKAKHVIIYLLLVIVTSSCIRDEAPNAEADILSCRLPGITMTTSPIINNNSVTLFVTPGTNISALAPEFTLTSGATITPASGTERNFNSPQEYQVTAADGIWKKTYAILLQFTISKIPSAERNTTYLWKGKMIKSSWNGPAATPVTP